MSRSRRLRCCVAASIVWAALLPSSAEPQESPGAGGLPRATPSPAENAARIELQLGQPTVVEAVETPLEELLTVDLAARHNLLILLDRPAIEEAGATTDVAVTWTLRGISLGSALDLILHPHGLTYMVRDEVLVITSKEAEEARTEARAYNVADLIAGEGSMDSLLEAVRIGLDRGRLRRANAPAGAGAGAIPAEEPSNAGPSVTVYRDVLIVRDTQRRHRALAQLLASLRAELHAPAIAIETGAR